MNFLSSVIWANRIEQEHIAPVADLLGPTLDLLFFPFLSLLIKMVAAADCLYWWRFFESMWAELNMASRHVDVNERRLRPVYGISFSLLHLEKS